MVKQPKPSRTNSNLWILACAEEHPELSKAWRIPKSIMSQQTPREWEKKSEWFSSPNATYDPVCNLILFFPREYPHLLKG